VIPDRSTFESKIAEVKNRGLFALGRELLDLVVAVLRERRAVLDQISRYEQMSRQKAPTRFNDYLNHLDAVLPVDFLTTFDSRRLKNCRRYLKALLIRMDRAHVDPARDKTRAQEVSIHEDRLQSVSGKQTFSPDYERVREEYREMIDEFRVSVFAQELKTAYPVSIKRLEKKWRELKGLG